MAAENAKCIKTAWGGPWGVSFAINLTPDKETGIAEWSEDHFIQSMRTGKHQGQANGRDILPPMPWENTKAMTDDDLKAGYAYLRSIPAVKNQVPLPVPPAAAGKRSLLISDAGVCGFTIPCSGDRRAACLEGKH